MNDLNAQQIVLLTLLVSFVTSIATGITTVSLLEQAPAPVTQTINRVVERTVERILPETATSTDRAGKVTVTKTPEKEVVTVVVNAEELTIDAVNKNSKSLARIYQKNGSAEDFVGLGIVTDTAGHLVTDAKLINSSSRYLAVYQSGKFNLNVDFQESNKPYALLSITPGQQNVPTDFSPAIFADSQNLKLAQTVISLSGKDTNNVATGIISNLETVTGALTDAEVASSTTPTTKIKLIEVSADTSNILPGSIILNLKGELIGARMNVDPSRLNTYIPSNEIKVFLAGLSNSGKTTQ